VPAIRQKLHLSLCPDFRDQLFPVLIEDVQPPIGFRSIQAAHLENWGGAETTQAFPRLIADIAALIGRPPIEAGRDDDERKLGERYDYAGGDYARAREWYEKAAAKGDTWAMIQLAFQYQNGQGVAQDWAKALEWYKQAYAKETGPDGRRFLKGQIDSVSRIVWEEAATQKVKSGISALLKKFLG
jgi:tetratricopeptide (TPR) repeat protein